MKPDRKIDWDRLKTMALSLGLPGVEETTSLGQATLKAHGKLWVCWSPHEDAPVFKVPFEEREILVEAEPSMFFVTDHYKGSPLILVRPERLDLDPSFAAAYAILGQMHTYRGRPDETIPLVEKAIGGQDGRRSWTLNRHWATGLTHVVAGLPTGAS
jgi:hypothetical protein